MSRILFVDDEPALLDGLRVRLRGCRSQWEMVFVESGARAVVELELHPVDVIVADMRMPRMDGAELLTIVRERWPQTIRLVLSGYSEEEQSTRLLALAHQYLSKPCEPQRIESSIRRCLALKELLKEPALQALVGSVGQLPILASMRQRLTSAIDQQQSTAREIAQLICEDPPFAAKLLQVTNSAFFRLPRSLASIEQAVGYVGMQALRSLLADGVSLSWPDTHAIAGLPPAALQGRALRVAAAARAIAAGTPIAAEAYLAGLLHNIGHWVLLQQRPAQMQTALELARTRHLPLHCAEQEVLGASHAEVGAYLLGLWGLPASVVDAIALQYSPQPSPVDEGGVLATLCAATNLTTATMPCASGVFERADVAIDEACLRSLHAPFNLTQAQQRIASLAEEVPA